MSEYITTEIAAAMQAGIVAVVSADVTVYADGVADTTGTEQDAVKFPCVALVVNECMPRAYKSVLRQFPVTIEAATWYPDDRFQSVLYQLGHQVTQWLADGPELTLTLAHFDAVYVPTAPDRGIEGRVQFFRWQVEVNTRKVV